jgi:nucleoside-diphosphate-sugar epimerase
VTDIRVGVIGAISLVGRFALPALRAADFAAVAYTRQTPLLDVEPGILWRSLSEQSTDSPDPTPSWLCLAPIWVLPDYFPLLEANGVRRVVALSSTSRFTKADSDDAAETVVAAKLAKAEARLQSWAEERGIEWVVLRPTLIYGQGQDKNISEIARFARRFRFFPLLGEARGLRQPVHAEDVASACVAALRAPAASNRAYNISGGETLSYRDMVARVFTALGRRTRLVSVPRCPFRVAISIIRHTRRFRHWSPAMADRMNQHMTFDHADAAQDLDFKPRPFTLGPADLPPRPDATP